MFLSIPLNAQVEVQIGGKAGINFSTLSQSDGIDYEFTSGLVMGPTLEIKSPSSYVSVQAELLFFQNGARFKESGTKIEMNNIQIPIVIKYRLNTPLSDRSPILLFGPYFNALLSSEGRIPGVFAAVSLDDLTEKNSYGLLLGAEISFTSFHIGIQSTFDFTEAYRSQFSTGEKNFGIAFTAGFKF